MRRALILLTFLSPTHLSAAETSSEYTVIDRSKCQTLQPANSEENEAEIIFCKGYADQGILLTTRNERDYLAVGTDPRQHCAAKQSFTAPNTVANKVEWRIKDGAPVATILRWTVSIEVDGKAQKKDWLAVTRLEPQNSCILALVDTSWPNANDKARKIADEIYGDDVPCIGTSLRTFANEGTEVEVGSFGPACEVE